MNTLKAENISKVFLKKTFFGLPSLSAVEALQGIRISLTDEKIYGLVGESGCGKSTLAKILVGLLAPTTGRVFYNGEDYFARGSALRRKNRFLFQMVFQNPFSSLNPRMRIFDILNEGLENQGISRRVARQKIGDLLIESALSLEMLEKYPHQLSGGERQRMAIVRAFLVEPGVLILDEPVSSLDVSVRKQILDLIRKLLKGRRMIVLLISHDLAVIRYLADIVFVMEEGAIVEEASVEKLFHSPSHPYTRELLTASLGLNMDPLPPAHSHSHPGECCP